MDDPLVRHLLDLAAEAVVIVSPHGLVMGQSLAVARLFGEAVQGVVGQPLGQWLQVVAGPARLPDMTAWLERARQGGQQSLDLEAERSPDGPQRLHLTVEPVLRGDDTLVAYLVRISPMPGAGAPLSSAQLAWAERGRLLERLPVGVIAVDAEGDPVLANAAAYRLLGKEPGALAIDELVRRIETVQHPDGVRFTAEELTNLWETMRGELAAEVQLGLTVDTGAVRWLDVTVLPLSDDGNPQGALLVLQDASADIDERQRLGRRVREQAAALQYVRGQAQAEHEAWARDAALLNAQLDSTIEGVLITGLGREVLAWNGRFRDLFDLPGIELQELSWDYVYRLISPLFRTPAAFGDHVAAMYADPVAESLTWWELADGRWLVLHTLPARHEADGRELGRIWAFRDITANRRMALRAEEQRVLFQAILDLMPANVCVRDEQGRYLLANQAAARAYDATVEHVLGRTDAELRAALGRIPYTPAAMSRTDAEIISGVRDETQFELLADHTVGGNVDYLTTKTAFTWPDGRRVVLAVSQDITALLRAERDSAERERLLQEVIDLLPAQVFMKDGAGRYVIANQTMADLLGVPMEALLGKMNAELDGIARLSADHRAKIERTDAEVLRGATQVSYHVTHDDVQGQTRAYLITKRSFEYRGGPAVLGVGLDVTVQYEVERRLEAQRNWFQQISDFIPGTVFVRDAAGRYVLANRGLGLSYPRSGADLLGKTDAELAITMGVDPATVRQIEAADRAILAGRSTHERYMLSAIDLDGRTSQFMVTQVPFALEDGSPAVLGVSVDITRAQEADLMEKQLELIYDSAPVGILLIDRRGVITRANRRLAEMLGRPIQAIEGYDLFGSHATRDLGVTAQVAKCLREGIEVIGETSDVAMGGGNLRVRYGLAARRDPSGRIEGVLGIVEDITAYHRLQERLREAAKLEALGQLAGGLAHSFRNLLTVINGYTEMALLNRRLSSHLRRDLTQVLEAGQRAAELARQLLAFSRHNVLELSVFDLNEVLREMALMLRPVLGDTVTLNMSLSKEPLLVRADRAQVEQMIINLAINARQAMPQGGAIAFRSQARRFTKPGRTDYLDPLPGSYALFEISDMGIGIEPDVRRHLFEPFYTTKPNGEGTGLGLSMVYGLVQGLGGGIDVRSVPGHGATFRIYLPRAGRDAAIDQGNGSRRLPRARRGELVLLVDGHEEQRELLRRMLGPQLGYTVFDAESGAEALSLCQELREQFDLLLADVRLPDMTGPELAAQMRTLCGLRRTVYLTATEQAARGEIPADARCLVRPYQKERVARAVREVLDAPLTTDVTASSTGDCSAQGTAAT